MDFKITKIPPEGRNKYGNYTSASRTSKIITTYVNGGNGTTTTDDYVDNGEKPTPKKNCTIALSSSDGTFKWSTIVSDTKDSAVINVVGYGEIEKVPIYIGDISKEPTSTTDIPQHRNWDIRGIPSNGLTLNVEGNGTLDAKINIVIDENISNEKGTLHIPCSVYVGADEKAPYAPTLTESGTYVDNAGTYEDYVEWVNARGDCKTMWLEYNYVIVVDAVDSYILDLDNEIAAISCNADGSFMAGIEMPTCRATLYYGSSVADGVSYYITYPSHQNVKNVSIDPNTGILTFNNNFSFDGIRLEIKVSAVHNGNTFSKIMTINRLYAGQNGSTGADAVNRWIVPSVNAITFNPNTISLSVSSITAKVMKREGAKEIVEDTSTQIYWGWDTKTPTTAYTGAITVQSGKGYICFALKNGSTIYEIETVPIVKEGQKGEKGDKGDSAYNLVLTNNNASINCDSNGNILSGAVKPACSAYLYYGNTVVNNATYTISTTATGVSLNGNSLSYGSNFGFSGDSVNITFNAYIGSSLILSSIMTITKVKNGANGTNGKDGTDGKDGTNGTNGTNGKDGTNGTNGTDGKDGKDGADGVSYWLVLSNHVFKVDKDGNCIAPTSISLEGWKQVGGNTPVKMTSSECTIKVGKNTNSPSTTTSTITYASDANYYSVVLYVNSKEVDRQNVPVVKDGPKGDKGDTGDTGSQGPKGPTVRGPYDFSKLMGSDHRFCSGTKESGGQDIDAEFIDVIYFDDRTVGVSNTEMVGPAYYKCKKSHKSYNITSWQDWRSYRNLYWEQSTDFNFVSTDLLLADQAIIANFIFSNGKLISQEKNLSTGKPLLSIDGANGIIEAEKGVFKGNLWAPYRDLNAELTTDRANINLNVDDPLYIKITCKERGHSLKTPAIVYLPKITTNMLGARYCVLLDGMPNRNSLMPSRLSPYSGDYILDPETLNPDTVGKLNQNKNSTAALTGIYLNSASNIGYVELVATYIYINGTKYNIWLVVNKTGERNMMVDRATTSGTTTVLWTTLII